ncbi:LysR family transcriptional regulator [Photobacterium sp. DA100]|uniref:LysR family transcriptional regulator n=1 Tax=Photobacterium sp. DA100 TaxID=3027472 RepID=UPI0032AF3757
MQELSQTEPLAWRTQLPMKKRHNLLPSSLNGLRVFEASARHLSFTLAAEELNVTQSAVSRQIRQLEDKLGFSLFIRHHRSLELSAQGKEIALLLTRQYSELNQTIRQLKTKETGTLRVQVAMSFAVRWLIPRLHSFKSLNPDVNIILSSSMGHDNELLHLEEGDYDIAIYNVPEVHQSSNMPTFLRKEYLAPVYSELLTKTDEPIDVDKLIANYPRLHPTPDQSDWREWLSRNGRSDQIKKDGLTFNTLDMALTSCFAGQGITITDLMLVVHELQQGYLKLPTGATIVTNNTWQYYYQTISKGDTVTRFIDWMVEEERKDMAALTRMAEQHGWKIID